jgi:hypothetical protein
VSASLDHDFGYSCTWHGPNLPHAVAPAAAPLSRRPVPGARPMARPRANSARDALPDVRRLDRARPRLPLDALSDEVRRPGRASARRTPARAAFLALCPRADARTGARARLRAGGRVAARERDARSCTSRRVCGRGSRPPPGRAPRPRRDVAVMSHRDFVVGPAAGLLFGRDRYLLGCDEGASVRWRRGRGAAALLYGARRLRDACAMPA